MNGLTTQSQDLQADTKSILIAGVTCLSAYALAFGDLERAGGLLLLLFSSYHVIHYIRTVHPPTHANPAVVYVCPPQPDHPTETRRKETIVEQHVQPSHSSS
jgi:hypothetical protein